MEVKEDILKKWANLIDAAVKYWISCEPTGLSDDQFNRMESQAMMEDGFSVRDYVFDKYLKGTKTKNQYIEKLSKFKVSSSSTMLKAIEQSAQELNIKPEDLYCTLKYDGSSIAIYLDPKTGRPLRIVTVGNLNLDNYGVDQTWKLMHFLPKQFPLGIVAIQCEALIDTMRLNDSDPEKARQRANGLINSKYCETEVNNLLTLRAYRYYCEADSVIKGKDYRDVINSFPIVQSKVDGHIMFAPAQIWTLEELKKIPGYTETDRTVTSTGTFLNDGWVLYNRAGVCQRALKYAGAGESGESIKTKVLDIQWNDQGSKGKDSWSANVIIEPVQIKGSTVRKPSAGSVSKLVKNNITPGAIVGIILANSTIPMVGDVVSGGNGDYKFPKCACGYQMSDKDVYGSLLKCGNPNCSERLNRMKAYLANTKSLDLNDLLVIDRFKWENTDLDYGKLLDYVKKNDEAGYYDYLKSYMKTDLQLKNLNLVWKSSFKALYERLSRNIA